MKSDKKIILFMAVALLVCYSSTSMAELAYIDPGTNKTVLDQVVDEFLLHAKNWQTVIQTAAENLFWSLVLISMVWTFGMMILRKADIGDFFAEFTRFIIFTGFYFWLLTNAVSGQNIAGTLIGSMQVLGNNASGLSGGTNYVNIMDVGYDIWSQTVSNLTIMSPVDSFVSIVLGLIVFLVLTVIAVNMLLLLISGWVLMYAGIFFLGFGGARWTSDIAINYFKTVFALGIQLLTMILIVGIGSNLLTNFHASMSTSAIKYEELGVMAAFAITLLILATRLPALLAGVITGSSIGAVGTGNFGAGGILGAVGGAAAGIAMAGTATANGIGSAVEAGKNLAGGGIAEAMKHNVMPEGFKPPGEFPEGSTLTSNISNASPMPKDDPRHGNK